MKAVQLVEIGSPLQAREIPSPTVAEDEVLVRVKAAGICHSDVHYRAGVSPAGPLPITLGHEIARRLQMATPATYSPKESGPEYGKMSFAPVSGHGTSGFGAAVGAGAILKLSAEKMANAMGIAGYVSPPSTFRKWTDTVPCRMTKYGPPGFTAEVGVRAALLADRGYYGDTNIFEGEHGYWRFTGFERWNKDVVVAGLGST